MPAAGKKRLRVLKLLRPQLLDHVERLRHCRGVLLVSLMEPGTLALETVAKAGALRPPLVWS